MIYLTNTWKNTVCTKNISWKFYGMTETFIKMSSRLSNLLHCQVQVHLQFTFIRDIFGRNIFSKKSSKGKTHVSKSQKVCLTFRFMTYERLKHKIIPFKFLWTSKQNSVWKNNIAVTKKKLGSGLHLWLCSLYFVYWKKRFIWKFFETAGLFWCLVYILDFVIRFTTYFLYSFFKL